MNRNLHRPGLPHDLFQTASGRDTIAQNRTHYLDPAVGVSGESC
jgi:hypothetical protein